jgi:hypothetical protein
LDEGTAQEERQHVKHETGAEKWESTRGFRSLRKMTSAADDDLWEGWSNEEFMRSCTGIKGKIL